MRVTFVNNPKRQFKFRAWVVYTTGEVESQGRFYYDISVRRDSEGNTSCLYFDEEGFGYPLPMQNTKVQQFTGMLDAYEQEIFEGDLVSYKYFEEGQTFVGEVVYSELFACYSVLVGNACDDLCNLVDFKKYLKVVGNKFEK
jgi:hypothetical protein